MYIWLQVSDILGLGGCDCRLVVTLSTAALLGDEALGLSANARDRRFLAEDGEVTCRGGGPLSVASNMSASPDADGLGHRALALTDLVGCM
jgi:hypothetical protein